HLAHPGPHREAPCAVRHGPARRRPAGRGRGGRRARRADRTVARTRRERRMSGPDLPDLSSLPIFHDTEPDRPGPRRPGNGGGAGPDRRPSPPQNTWTASVEQTARPTGPQPGPATHPGPGGPGANGAPPSGGAASPWVGAVARAEREYHGQPGNPRLRDAEFWRQVNSLRGEVSSRLTTALSTRELDEEQREALGQELIQQVVRDHNDALLSGGQRSWTTEYQVEVTRALFDALFRLGRLQPLIDTPDVENIEITGTAPVLMLMGDGRRTYAEPIADSDAELIDFLQFLASRDPANERSFTRANPFLNLDLPGRVRLAAVGWVVPWPRVTIRLQRLQSVDLELLRRNGTVDTVLAEFLGAAVRARKSIVVSGQGQGSGKTTLLRALCASLDPWESIATIETDYELYLHLEPEKHKRVVALRTREGSGEMSTSGRRVGEIDTNVNVYESLRHNISRVIVGEVRGPEIVSMFQAMQMGNGSLSTVHADGARDVV